MRAVALGAFLALAAGLAPASEAQQSLTLDGVFGNDDVLVFRGTGEPGIAVSVGIYSPAGDHIKLFSAIPGPDGAFETLGQLTVSDVFGARGTYEARLGLTPDEAPSLRIEYDGQRAYVVPDYVVDLVPMGGNMSVEAGEALSFTAKITDGSLRGVVYGLEGNVPAGASIGASDGRFAWIPVPLQGSAQGSAYTFDVVATKEVLEDRQSVTVVVFAAAPEPGPEPSPAAAPDPAPSDVAPPAFVEPGVDPRQYVDRYESEPAFRQWFDENFPGVTIHAAVGLPEPVPRPAFVEPGVDPRQYVDRYESEPAFRQWFDENFPGVTIHAAVGLPEPVPRPAFVEPGVDPQQYVDRYESEPAFRQWFDENFPGVTIHAAVGLPEPVPRPAFVEPGVDPQQYVDRYESEPAFRQWFDENFPGVTIHAAVGLPEPVPRPAFVDPERDPRYYVARYDAEPAFRQWFDENFPGVTIYEAAGTNESAMNRTAFGQCGIGTRLVGGECVAPDPPPIEAGPEPPEPEPKPAAPEPPPPPRDPRPGGCLIATAAHGSEMSQQVQMLREVRDRTLLSTASGAGFADGFNALYYSFSPAVADAQRESPLLREAIRALIAPMLLYLSVMTLAEEGSEAHVVAAGSAAIALTLGTYVAAPVLAAAGAARLVRSRRRRPEAGSGARRPPGRKPPSPTLFNSGGVG